MAEVQAESGEEDAPNGVRRHRLRRILSWVGAGLLILLAVTAAVLWVQREEIARQIIEREIEKRGVRAQYEIEKLGLRTQQLRNVVIGDPGSPSLTAQLVRIQTRVKLDGSVDVFRITARGVRLRGQLLPSGRVSWGELDKLLPPPSGEPFRLPDVAVDIQNTTIALATPNGPLGFAVRGEGNLTGGFAGRVVMRSPGIDFGNCSVTNLRGAFDVRIRARNPLVEGPFTGDRLACPASDFAIDSPRFVIDSRFSEGFDKFNGSGRLSAATLVAGVNGLARVNGNLTFQGSPGDASGRIDLAAQRSRAGPILADRTRLQGRYRINAQAGTQVMVGEYSADSAQLSRDMVEGVAGSLEAMEKTPLGPIATPIGRNIRRAAQSFDVRGDIRLVNAPAGGFVAIETANVRSASGARIDVSGDRGIRFDWPSGQIGIDANVRISGGGLPNAVISLSQPRPGGPMTGVARISPLQANGARLELAPIRFAANPDGSSRFQTVGRLTGSFSAGRVRGLQLPIEGRVSPNGRLVVAPRCINARFDQLVFRELTLNQESMTICPVGEAIIVQPPNGQLQIGARIAGLDLSGRLGDSPVRLAAGSARITGQDFALVDARVAMGQSDSPVIITANRLTGTFEGAGVSGAIAGATAVIGNVPLRMSDIDGRWLFRRGDLIIDGDLVLSDRADPPRFYPLTSNDMHFVMSGNRITTTGTLRHPDSGTRVSDVRIEHHLGSGEGHAVLDVPGITFGENLQPEELTRLTEGVVAIVQGTITGQGRINWSGAGEVTSTGDFHTQDMDLAAPFGPVEGLTTSIHFSDLLGLETAPGQVAQIDRINPGIIVENGVITYQLLPNQLVKIERGAWPFMGGRLILHETVLNFGAPSAKRLTFELDGFNAKMFVDTLGFEGLEITGIFDGVLPMIFDDAGGRIVGGRLQSRPPGGHFRYTGTKPDAGLMAGVAFDLLSDIRYRNMIIRLDGDLAGEFATRFTIEQVSLGQEGGFVAGLVRGALRKVPLQVNLNISGPFRALIQMAKGFEDPTAVIEPVMPFPLDAPGIEVETRVLRKEEDQERVTPIDEVDVSTEPPQPSE